jgi:hypothetical protein
MTCDCHARPTELWSIAWADHRHDWGIKYKAFEASRDGASDNDG